MLRGWEREDGWGAIKNVSGGHAYLRLLQFLSTIKINKKDDKSFRDHPTFHKYHELKRVSIVGLPVSINEVVS